MENIEIHSTTDPKERIIFFNKEVDAESIAEVSKQIIQINESDKHLKKVYKISGLKYKPKPIKIYIDSYGGSVYSIFGLVSIIDKSKTPIHTIVTGTAMSAGLMLLISGHKRFAYKLSTIMHHQVSGWSVGKVQDQKIDVKETNRLQTLWEEEIEVRTNITKKQLASNLKTKTDWYMSSKEALKLNIIDKII